MISSDSYVYNFLLSRREDSQRQETFLAPSVNKKIRNYDRKCSNHPNYIHIYIYIQYIFFMYKYYYIILHIQNIYIERGTFEGEHFVIRVPLRLFQYVLVLVLSLMTFIVTAYGAVSSGVSFHENNWRSIYENLVDGKCTSTNSTCRCPSDAVQPAASKYYI